MPDVAAIVRLYAAAFNRPPDAAGLAYWAAANDNGWSIPAIAAWFAASPEFIATYGALTDAEFVARLYKNILGRDGETTGVAYWVNDLAIGDSRGNVLNGFAQSAENIVHSMQLNEPPATVPPTVITDQLDITGFARTPFLQNINNVTVGSDPAGPLRGLDGNLVVGDLINVKSMTLLNNVGSAHTVPFTRVEITGTYGDTAFTEAGGAYLVLDQTPDFGLNNVLTFGAGGGQLTIGDFAFDGAFRAGEKVTLTQHGLAVYDLNHVHGAGSLAVTQDANTMHGTLSVRPEQVG